MKRLTLLLFSLLYPAFLFAQDSMSGGSLSFAPPPGDYSVIFLGNLFGVVDGVLHGTGSQIMGSMFGVFNAAVLALGGIVIMYTLTVSTMNTAQEGQLLGQKWSSIWVPIRSTVGLALLIPKASGYCMMQVFIMWVVVQGVGAADKVWNAALDYLNRGGVIIQAQMNPAISLTADSSYVAKGAMVILSGQVCMAGVQQLLYQQRQSYLNQKANKGGPCYGTPSSTMETICNYQVPDLIATVNAVAVQSKSNSPASQRLTMPMPNLDSSSPYATSLNGICGKITWYPYQPPSNVTSSNTSTDNTIGVGEGNMQTIELSRAIAIQQMYTDLAIVAQQIVNNDPLFNTSASTGTTSNDVSPVAMQQYGVPFDLSGSPCTSASLSSNQCVSWGGDTSLATSSPIFNGTSFQGAISDYNAVMLPSLTLAQEAQDTQNASAERQFIAGAEQQGWILAGSYFWNIVQLNTSAMTGQKGLTDSGSGLDDSAFTTSNMTNAFGSGKSCQTQYANLCNWMNFDLTKINQFVGLFDGSSFMGTPIPQPSGTEPGGNTVQSMLKQSTDTGAITGKGSSTVYGYISNSLKVQLPGQPGFNPPNFNFQIKVDIEPGILYLPHKDFPCGKLAWIVCIGNVIADFMYNYIFRWMFNFFLDMVSQVINVVVFAFLSLPLEGIATLFKNTVSIIEQPGANPVVALANMGTTYINFSNDLWILLLEISIATSLIPVFGIFIWAVIALCMPLLMAWLSIMVSIGFTTAYYLPFVPYMIFTFGAIAWFMAVIEAMVAGPIVALGVTHPEGNEALGKGEQALMILLNIFLRPAMMIIGYIAAIALIYVAVWLLNAGYQNAASFIMGNLDTNSGIMTVSSSGYGDANTVQQRAGQIPVNGYTGWAGIYGFFFVILVYTTLYLTLVQRSFQLITMLPDKVLRFIGGAPENIGAETAQWGEEVKGKVQEGGKETAQAAQQIDSKLSGYGQKAVGAVKGAVGGANPGAGGGMSAVGAPDSTDSGE